MANPTPVYPVLTNFNPVRGKWDFRPMRFKASVAIEMGTAVGVEISSNNTTGLLTTMGAENAAGADFKGILWDHIKTSDEDYAVDGKLRLVAVPLDDAAIAEFTATAGTLVDANIYSTVEFHSSGKGLAVNTLGKGARIEGRINADRGLCSFPMPATETA